MLNILALILGVGNTLFELYKWRHKPKPTFVLQKFQEDLKEPIKTRWSIRILFVDKPIEKCRILYNGIPLPWWDYYKIEKTLPIGGGGNVRIPFDLETEDAEIKVMDNKKTLKRVKFVDIIDATQKRGAYEISFGKRPP